MSLMRMVESTDEVVQEFQNECKHMDIRCNAYSGHWMCNTCSKELNLIHIVEPANEVTKELQNECKHMDITRNAYNDCWICNSCSKEINCPHRNKVRNYENSHLVCYDCGVQMEEIFCLPDISRILKKEYDYEKNDDDFDSEIYDFIDNCRKRLYLYDSLTHEIYNHFIKIKNNQSKKGKIPLAVVILFDGNLRSKKLFA